MIGFMQFPGSQVFIGMLGKRHVYKVLNRASRKNSLDWTKFAMFKSMLNCKLMGYPEQSCVVHFMSVT